MNQLEIDDAVPKRFEEVATVAAIAAVIGIMYVCDRAYRRWLKGTSPLTAPRARVEHMKAGYRDRRETVGDVAEIIGAVVSEVEGRARDGTGCLVGEPATPQHHRRG
jgi:hypothetical protein